MYYYLIEKHRILNCLNNINIFDANTFTYFAGANIKIIQYI